MPKAMDPPVLLMLSVFGTLGHDLGHFFQVQVDRPVQPKATPIRPIRDY